MKYKFCPKPSEAYGFWNYYFPGFGDNEVDLRKKDRFLAFFQHHFSEKSKMVLTKITGFSRVAIFDASFEKVKVVWIERDPRKVLKSILKQKWGAKHLSDREYMAQLDSFISMWALRIVAYYEEQKSLPFARFSLKLEDYLSNPKQQLREILEFVNVSKVDFFADWKEDELTPKENKGRSIFFSLTEEQERKIEYLLEPLLLELGYDF